MSAAKKWMPLVVISLASFILVLDTTIMNVSISALVADLDTTITSIQAVITAYSLVMAAFIITGSKLADIFGRKKIFILGVAMFGIGSFIASIADNIATLAFGWTVIEGLGAALMLPVTMLLLIEMYSGKQRALALGVWGGIAAAGAAFGPIIGGLLTTYASWRWAFRLEVLTVLVILGLIGYVRSTYRPAKKPKIDYLGVLLSSTGLAAVVFAIIESADWGVWTAKTATQFLGISPVPFFFVGGLVLLGAFVAWESFLARRGGDPLVNLSVFKFGDFNSGTFVLGMSMLAQGGLMFATPIFLQTVLQFSAFQTGLTLLPLSVGVLVTSLAGSKLSYRFLPRLVIQIGVLMFAIGALVAREGVVESGVDFSFLAGLGLVGLGLGLTIAPTTNLSLARIPEREQSDASGVSNTAKQFGMSLGTAVIGAVITSVAFATTVTIVEQHAESMPEFSGVEESVLRDKIETGLRKIQTDEEFEAELQALDLPAPTEEQALKLKNAANISGARAAYLAVFLAAGVMFFVSLFLPRTKLSADDEVNVAI